MDGFRFTRRERLKSRKRIGLVFSEGKTVAKYPILIKYRNLAEADGSYLRVGFSVPKKKFPRAVDRNLLKRRMREAFRLNKHIFYQGSDQYAVEAMIIYTGSQLEDYAKIEKASIQTLRRLLDAK